MASLGNVDAVKSHFERSRASFLELAGELVDDPELAVEDAAARFERMIPDMAYLDRPKDPMAGSVFWCSASLALCLALKDRGVSVHDYGRALLAQAERGPVPDGMDSDVSEWMDPLQEAAAASQREQRPGEFVFEVLPNGEGFDWGMNVKSCAICHQFSKFDAMDLVPYMCATDDVMSDRLGQGLRRSGTIALGAHQCDFRYQKGGEPARVAERHPERIRIRSTTDT